MALTRLTGNFNNVENLPDQPTESAQEIKAIFDKSGIDLKNFINTVLIPEIESYFLQKAGGELSGALTTQNVLPVRDNISSLGTSVRNYNIGYINKIVQKVPEKAGSNTQSNHTFGFAWGVASTNHTFLRAAIDNDVKNYFIPICPDHTLEFVWSSGKLMTYIDGTYVGNVKLES